MNKRAIFTFFTTALILSAGMAFSASVADGIIAQLTKQGFSSISSETTWLGRIRILAMRKDGSREIVINPRTGEILRDQFTALNGKDATKPVLDEVGDATGPEATGSDDSGSSDGGGSGGDGSGGDGSGGDGSTGSGSGTTGSGNGSGDGDKSGDGGDDEGSNN